MRKSKTLILSILMAVLTGSPLSSFAGSCAYTIKQIRQQLPFPMQDVRIILKKEMSNGLCSMILKVSTPRGPRFVPVFAGKDGVIIGTLFKDKRSITGQQIEKLQTELSRKLFLSVKDNLSGITIATYEPKNANGKVLYAFVDPLCPFCRMMEKYFTELADKSGYTIKIVPFIVHGKSARDKVIGFICSHKTFKDYLNGNFGNARPCRRADEILSRARRVELKLGLNGTPTFFTSDGKQVVGADMSSLKKILKIGR